MSWWSRLVGGKSESELKPQRLDYLSEALALERQGDYDAALTSYRLALRDQPDDPKVLQNMAIAFSQTGRLDEAVRCYRPALDLAPRLSGPHFRPAFLPLQRCETTVAHSDLAFLRLKRGDTSGAREHLERFLNQPPKGAEADRWVRHARQTLDALRDGAGDAVPDTDL